MKGWVIYKYPQADIKPEAYEINRFIESARKENVDLKVYSPAQFDLTVTREDKRSVLVDSQAIELPDFVLPRMGAGTTYFALAVMRHLERLGVLCFNSSVSVDTVKDKLYTHQILAEKGLPVPKTMLVKFPVNADLAEKHIGFPMIVKTLSGSQGKGVFMVESKSSFHGLMQLIESTGSNSNIILQECVTDSLGRDLRVITIGGRAVACMQRKSRNNEFKANFSQGADVSPFELTPEIEWLACETSRILGLDIGGIDLLFDKDHFKICEANSSPGFHGLESCCRVDIPREIFHFLRIRLGIFAEPETKQKAPKKIKKQKKDKLENQTA